MKKTRYKRILGLFILTFVMLFSNAINVFAEDAQCTDDVKNKNYWTDRYGINIEYISKGKYKITCNPKQGVGIDNKKVKFQLSEIQTYDGYVDAAADITQIKSDTVKHVARWENTSEETKLIKDMADNVILTPSKPITITRKGDFDDGFQGFAVTLHPTPDYKDPVEKACLSKKTPYCDPTKVDQVADNCFFAFEINLAVSADDSDIKLTTIKNNETIPTQCSSSTSRVDCNDYENKYSKDSFEYKFCLAKKNAKYSKTFNVDSEEKMLHIFENKEPFESTCKYKNEGDATLVFDSQDTKKMINDAYYYKEKNTDYYHAKVTYKKNVGTYIYNYEYGTEKEPASCTISCEEAVTVEYGAPILSTAGMCFQYKVKVTSRVTCGLGDDSDDDGGNGKTPEATKTTTTCEDIIKPRTSKLCTPKPLCVHKGGATYLQGGPNTNFDSCIKVCDKGKYTDKCVNKCYKQVYGKSTLSRKSNNSDLALYDVVKVEGGIDNELQSVNAAAKAPGRICDSDTSSKCYYYNSSDSNKIYWRTGVGTDRSAVKKANCSGNPCRLDTDSIWHRDINNKWGTTAWDGYTMYTQNGIPKTETCTDDCSWIGCAKGSYGDDEDFYLNPDQADQDDTYNEDVYQELVKQCKSSIGCTTTVSEYTISTDVKTGDGKNDKITINYPYSTNQKKLIERIKDKEKQTEVGKDEIQAQGTVKTNGLKDTSKNNPGTTILQRNFCYNEPSIFDYEDNSRKNYLQYQTEWTYPGTWINDKTQGMTYAYPGEVDGYTEFKNQFCLPRFAKEVNSKWAEYYFYQVHGKDSSYSIKNKTYLNNIECYKEDHTNYSEKAENWFKKITSVVVEEKDIDWNIHATTRNFGHFGWPIDIKCFYAILLPGDQGDNSNSKSGKSTTTSYCKEKGEETYVVRSVDLKNLFPSKDGSKLASPNETGRSPGFNWSEHATQTEKNKDYKSVPKEYTKWVQKMGYSVYDDKYLDYYIWLSKDDINKIRKEDHKVGEFSSTRKSVIENASHYQSDLIRGGSLKEAHYPEGKAITCNNMKNYTVKNECDTEWEVK